MPEAPEFCAPFCESDGRRGLLPVVTSSASFEGHSPWLEETRARRQRCLPPPEVRVNGLQLKALTDRGARCRSWALLKSCSTLPPACVTDIQGTIRGVSHTPRRFSSA